MPLPAAARWRSTPTTTAAKAASRTPTSSQEAKRMGMLYGHGPRSCRGPATPAEAGAPSRLAHLGADLLGDGPAGAVVLGGAVALAVPLPVEQVGQPPEGNVQVGRRLGGQAHLLDVLAVGPRRLVAEPVLPVQQRQHGQVQGPHALEVAAAPGEVLGLAPQGVG